MIFTIFIIIAYPVFLHYKKDSINDWIDFKFSHIVGRCRECRMFHIGSVQGFLYALLIYKLIALIK